MRDLTAREKIEAYATIKATNNGGETLSYGRGRGKGRFTMGRKLSELTDAECERVVKKMGLDAYIAKQEKKAEGERKTTIKLKPKPCGCGCGEMTRAGSKFRPGHDAKLKSALRKAAAEGDAKAQKELKARGWVQKGT